MSLFGALGAGVTGLGVQGEALSVVSDNLANVNTVGYKRNRVLFEQLVTSSGLSGTNFNAGGVDGDVIRSQGVQGALNSTDRTTDLALSGNGFFVTVGESNVTSNTAQFYTRAGAFGEDNLGFLRHSSGTFLLGWRTDSDGTIQDIQNPEAVELQSVGSSARPTSRLDLGANLNAATANYNYDLGLAPFGPLGAGVNPDQGLILANLDQVVADPTLADFITSSRFFDSQGESHDVSVAFVKRGDNLWDYVAFADGSDIINQAAGVNTRIGSGTIEFNADGSIKNQAVRAIDGTLSAANTLAVDWSGGVDQGQIQLNFGDLTGGISVTETALDAANLGPNEGVSSFTIDEVEATNAGIQPTLPFQLHSDGAGGLFIVNDPAGVSGGPFTSATVTIPAPLLTPQTFEFDNGVSVTLDDGYIVPAAAGQIGANVTGVNNPPVGTGVGTNGIVQFSSPNNTRFVNQNGFGSGTLANVTVDEEGFVVGAFTNGETQRLFKLVIAVFQDPVGLDPVSGNLFRQTDKSGEPLFKEAGIGNTATVVSGALEQSTVDIATEFSNMIVTQRAFSASSKIISTVDQMLAELLSLR